MRLLVLCLIAIGLVGCDEKPQAPEKEKAQTPAPSTPVASAPLPQSRPAAVAAKEKSVPPISAPSPAHENTRADINEALAKFAPGWMAKDCGSEMSPGLRDVLGKKNVLVTHPLSATLPCVLGRRLDVVPNKKTFIHLVVGHHPEGSWLLSVTADHELVHKVIGKETAPDGWVNVDVDLSEYAGQIITVQLINASNGGANEAGYWAKIEVE